MKKTLVSVISNVNRSKVLESTFLGLSGEKYDHHVILLSGHKGGIAKILEEAGLSVHFIPYHGKRSLIPAFLRTWRLLRKLRPHILHCQLFEASLIGTAAGMMAGIRNRVYTRHHSVFHHTSHPSAVKYDRFINRNSHHIIAVSETVRDVLMQYEKVPEKKITVIHHGFDLEYFNKGSGTDKTLLNKYLLERRHPRIGVISRFTDWKGINYTIEAFKQALDEFPEAVLLLGNSIGEYERQIRQKLKEIPEEHYRILDFEPEPAALYAIFDIFVHVPVSAQSEAFGQVYIESLAAGVPSVFTLSGIGNSILIHEKNCLVVPYKDAGAINAAIRKIINDPAFAALIAENGRNTVRGKFGIEAMIRQLESVYDSY